MEINVLACRMATLLVDPELHGLLSTYKLQHNGVIPKGMFTKCIPLYLRFFFLSLDLNTAFRQLAASSVA